MPDLVEHDLVVSGSLDEAGQVGARPSHASSSLLRPPDIKPQSMKNKLVGSTFLFVRWERDRGESTKTTVLS